MDSEKICPGGSFAPHWGKGCGWHFHKCDTCGTIAIPHVTRWLDYTYVAFCLGSWWRDKKMDKELGEPIFFRVPRKGRWFGWEVYGWRRWFFTFSPGRFEIQINRWPVVDKSDD